MIDIKKPEAPKNSCFVCKNYAGEQPYPHCAKYNQMTSTARAYKTVENDCFEKKSKDGEK